MKDVFFAARAASVHFITLDPTTGRLAVGHSTRNAARLRLEITPGLVMRSRSVRSVIDMRTGDTVLAPPLRSWAV